MEAALGQRAWRERRPLAELLWQPESGPRPEVLQQWDPQPVSAHPPAAEAKAIWFRPA